VDTLEAIQTRRSIRSYKPDDIPDDVLAKLLEAVRHLMIRSIDFSRLGTDLADGYAIIFADDSCPACEALHAAPGER